MTIKNTVTGAALALAAAGLFASLPTQVVAEEAAVHCYGVTSCKGQNDCKTAENACKGQASCKGHGFKALTLAECNAAGGKVGE
ncbi:MAG: BufA2 family periplasmic bufferin-type metallophore [Pseudomonas sp.]